MSDEIGYGRRVPASRREPPREEEMPPSSLTPLQFAALLREHPELRAELKQKISDAKRAMVGKVTNVNGKSVLKKEDADSLIRSYQDGASVYELAKNNWIRLGYATEETCRSSIRRLLQRRGIKERAK